MGSNLQDKTYSIRVYSNEYVMPPFCTCCMSPTDEKVKISSYYIEKTFLKKETRTITTEIPICSECREHQKGFAALRNVLLSIALFFGIACGIYANKSEENIMPVISVAASFLVYFVLTLVVRAKKLPEKHTTIYESVVISSPFLTQGQLSSYIILTFTNYEYAKIFSELNAKCCSGIIENEKVNTAKGLSIYSISPPNRITFIIIFVVSLIAFAIFEALV